MSLTDPLHTLDARRSVPSKQLGEPGPDDATLLRRLGQIDADADNDRSARTLQQDPRQLG